MSRESREPILLTDDGAIAAPPALVRAGLETLPVAIAAAGAVHCGDLADPEPLQLFVPPSDVNGGAEELSISIGKSRLVEAVNSVC